MVLSVYNDHFKIIHMFLRFSTIKYKMYANA